MFLGKKKDTAHVCFFRSDRRVHMSFSLFLVLPCLPCRLKENKALDNSPTCVGSRTEDLRCLLVRRHPSARQHQREPGPSRGVPEKNLQFVSRSELRIRVSPISTSAVHGRELELLMMLRGWSYTAAARPWIHKNI
jgi:hypothetical protein